MNPGLIIFPIGVILVTIGGFIHMIARPDLENRWTRTLFDPKRPTPEERVTSEEMQHSQFNEPKSKWWTRIGISLCFIGMFFIAFYRPSA